MAIWMCAVKVSLHTNNQEALVKIIDSSYVHKEISVEELNPSPPVKIKDHFIHSHKVGFDHQDVNARDIYAEKKNAMDVLKIMNDMDHLIYMVTKLFCDSNPGLNIDMGDSLLETAQYAPTVTYHIDTIAIRSEPSEYHTKLTKANTIDTTENNDTIEEVIEQSNIPANITKKVTQTTDAKQGANSNHVMNSKFAIKEGIDPNDNNTIKKIEETKITVVNYDDIDYDSEDAVTKVNRSKLVLTNNEEIDYSCKNPVTLITSPTIALSNNDGSRYTFTNSEENTHYNVDTVTKIRISKIDLADKKGIDFNNGGIVTMINVSEVALTNSEVIDYIDEDTVTEIKISKIASTNSEVIGYISEDTVTEIKILKVALTNNGGGYDNSSRSDISQELVQWYFDDLKVSRIHQTTTTGNSLIEQLNIVYKSTSENIFRNKCNAIYSSIGTLEMHMINKGQKSYLVLYIDMGDSLLGLAHCASITMYTNSNKKNWKTDKLYIDMGDSLLELAHCASIATYPNSTQIILITNKLYIDMGDSLLETPDWATIATYPNYTQISWNTYKSFKGTLTANLKNFVKLSRLKSIEYHEGYKNLC